MTARFGWTGLARTPAFFLGVGVVLLVVGAAGSQEPAQSDTQTARDDAAAATPRYDRPTTPEHVRPQAYNPQRRRSIVHHYPYPYPGYYHNDETAGFRNPGGVGRHAEYYPPGDQFQVQNDPVRVAKFGVGGYPSRAEQMQAEQLGISRYNSIQQHIDNYAMPHWGFGFGVGGYGGFW